MPEYPGVTSNWLSPDLALIREKIIYEGIDGIGTKQSRKLLSPRYLKGRACVMGTGGVRGLYDICI